MQTLQKDHHDYSNTTWLVNEESPKKKLSTYVKYLQNLIPDTQNKDFVLSLLILCGQRLRVRTGLKIVGDWTISVEVLLPSVHVSPCTKGQN